jgi:hypothetical protein
VEIVQVKKNKTQVRMPRNLLSHVSDMSWDGFNEISGAELHCAGNEKARKYVPGRGIPKYRG